MSAVVYRMYDAADALLYVGCSTNPIRRVDQHRWSKPWFSDVAKVTFEHHANRNEALAAEKAAIQTEHPTHNERLRFLPPGLKPIPDPRRVATRVLFGQRIRDAREGRSLTRSELAAQVAVTPTAIWYWEKGVTAPKPNMQVAIATALGVDWAELFNPDAAA